MVSSTADLLAVSPDKNSANWPPKSPYEALLSSPSGRKRWQDHREQKRPRTPSPSPRRVPQTNMRSPYALESRLENPYESDPHDEDEDEETLQLKLAAIEAKLKLKRLQQAKDKEKQTTEHASMKRSPDRSTRILTSPSRKRLRTEDVIQVPVSPVRVNTAPSINRSPARIVLGIDKGLRAQDVSLKRARTTTHGLGPAFEKTPQRVKSFTERLADSRTNEAERAEKADRIRNARGKGFAIADQQNTVEDVHMSGTDSSAPQPSLLESARKKMSKTAAVSTVPTSNARPTRESKPMTSRASSKASRKAQDDDVDPCCGLRMSKRIIPAPKLEAMMADKELYPLKRLLREVKSPSYDTPDCEADYVVFGIIGSKSSPLDVKSGLKSTTSDKDSSSGPNDKKFMVLHLTDLEWELDLFLFGTAFTAYWRLPVGAVIAVVNPAIMPPRPHARDTGRFSLKLSTSADEILELGKSQDMGFCKARRKDGTECLTWINATKTEYCTFHVELVVSKARASRMEVNTVARGFTGMPGKKRWKNSYEVFEPERNADPGRKRDNVTGEAYYIGPAGGAGFIGGASAKTLLDNEDRADPEMMRQRLAKAEKERALRNKLGQIGNGAGATYLRATTAASSSAANAVAAADGASAGVGGAGTRGGGTKDVDGAGEQESGQAEQLFDAASLGLVGRAEDVRLSPVRGRRRGLHEQAEPVGWAGAFKRGLPPQNKRGGRAYSPEKGQGRLDGILLAPSHGAGIGTGDLGRGERSVSPSKKRARFLLGDKGLREPGRDSLGDAIGIRHDSDDDDLDII